ncbi:MAG: ATP-binding cassette domain-containing protein [Lachnospiraceae bacterium]|nr:ATP-binding cassette domain-containing protein [Lachnospiraceae bacterium]
MKETILEIKDLSVGFRMYERGLKQHELNIIKKMNLTIHEGEFLAIVGASGSGKSVLAHAALGLLPPNAVEGGEMYFCGRRLDKKLRREKVGTEMIMIPQSLTYLDPLMKIGKQVRGVHGSVEKQKEVFRRYGLKESVAKLYPFQLSGGMARRALIATAVITDAKLILADEPTPGLSEDLALETMNHFRDLSKSGCAILMITHDIELAQKYADTIAVFKDGEIVDVCASEDFRKGAEGLSHPYTKALWEALPKNTFFESVIPKKKKECERTVLLEGRNIGFRYGKGDWILRNVNISIRRGEVAGLVGPSGRGKSTLARVLAGYENPDEGVVRWKGRELPKKGYDPIQMIYQHPEKALNPRWRLKQSLEEGWVANDELLERLCIRKELWSDRWPNELSGGELQRFCVARVLGPKTEFIIADEMSTMLDAITQMQIWKVLMEEVRRRELGMLVITHNMDLAAALCDRIIDLSKMGN